MNKFYIFIFSLLLAFIICSKITNITNNYKSQNNIKKLFCGSGNNNYQIQKVKFTDGINNIKRILENDDKEAYNPINIYYDMTYLNNQKLNSSNDIKERINMIDNSMSRCKNIFKKLIEIKKPLNTPIKIKNEQDLKEWKFTKYKINSELMPNSVGIFL